MFEAQFTEKMDDCDAICPYCGHRFQVESEDYDEDARQEECSECGKKYWLHQSFSVTNHAKPDCELNGQEHKYERIKLNNGREADFCTICDDCQSVRD